MDLIIDTRRNIAVSPQHSIDFCPICGGGLCGIRICGLSTLPEDEERRGESIHGLIVCDECEAIWLDPDVSTDHVYPDPTHSRCPVCGDSLWGENSRWADEADIAALGWSAAVNHELDVNSDEAF